MLKTIRQSMKHQQTLNIMYMDDNGHITKRRIQVFRITGDSFQAYCFLRESKRTFKVDNVLAVVPVVGIESVAN